MGNVKGLGDQHIPVQGWTNNSVHHTSHNPSVSFSLLQALLSWSPPKETCQAAKKMKSAQFLAGFLVLSAGREVLPDSDKEPVFETKATLGRKTLEVAKASLERGAAGLLDYLEKCGMDQGKLKEDLDMDYNPSSGVLVTGKRDYKRTELMFSVPLPCLISTENIAETPLQVVKDSLTSLASQTQWIVIFLMQERIRGRDSKYFPVLDLMPPQPSSITYFNERELDALQDHELVQKAWEKESQYRKSYKHIFLDSLHMITPDEVSKDRCIITLIITNLVIP